MKLLLQFLIVQFLAQQSLAQNTLNDTLHKYSYFTNGYLKGAWSNGSGTGFFFKKGKATFFVTNYHVYTGYDPITQENQPCDTIAIRLKTDKDSFFIKVPSKRDSIIERRIKSLLIADLVTIKLNKLQAKFCDSIGTFEVKKLFGNDYITQQPNAIFFYGFPSNKVTYSKSSKMLVPIGETSYTKSQEINDTVYNLISKVNYTLTDTSFQKKYRKQYFLMSSVSKGGMSGSPVFGEYVINGRTQYRLIGVLRGGAKGLSEIVKIDQLLKTIKDQNR